MPETGTKTHEWGVNILKARNALMMTLGIGALGAAAWAGSKMNKRDVMHVKSRLKNAADKIMP